MTCLAERVSRRRTVLPFKTFDIWKSLQTQTRTHTLLYTYTQEWPLSIFSWISDHSSVAWRQWSKLFNLTDGHWARGNSFWSQSLLPTDSRFLFCLHTHTHTCTREHTNTRDHKRAKTAQNFLFYWTIAWTGLLLLSRHTKTHCDSQWQIIMKHAKRHP